MKNDLKHLTEKEIEDLLRNGTIGAADLTDNGICPTCFNREHQYVVYGDDSDKTIYEDEDFTCFLVGNPRSEGHTVIATKKHYKDMMEADPTLIPKMFQLAQKVMILLKETYHSESVYLCTMCDGPMNHFHIQLIPRYEYEKRGSKNFVKERKPYIEDKEKISTLREKLKEE